MAQYDVLLLPTKFYTEGFPGSVLDSYIAGIPVIVTEWKYSHEFVKDGQTGFIVPFENGLDEMVGKIKLLFDGRDTLAQMKLYAKEECRKYSEDKAWSIINKYL